MVTPTEASAYDDARLRIILFQQASLRWYKTYFKNADLSLLSAWSKSGIKYAVSMPENTPIDFRGMVYGNIILKFSSRIGIVFCD